VARRVIALVLPFLVVALGGAGCSDDDSVYGTTRNVGSEYSPGGGTTSSATPTLTGITPDPAGAGTPVRLLGTNFSTTASSNTVTFNPSQSTTPSVAAATALDVTVPDDAYMGNVTVTVGTATTAARFFTVQPSISSLSPTSGTAGTPVTIYGAGFDYGTQGNNSVTFGTQAATVSAVALVSGASPNTIQAAVPAGLTSGTVQVNVTVTDGSGHTSTSVSADFTAR
jgi:hypothetical protein